MYSLPGIYIVLIFSLYSFFLVIFYLFSNIKVIFQHLYSIRNWLLIEKILKSWAPITRKEYQLKSFLWHINQCRWKSRICLVVKWFSEWLSKKLWVFKSNSLKFCWCKNIYWGTKVFHFISFTSIELLVNIHVLYTGLYFPLVYFPFFTCKWFCSILISPRHSCVSREIILDIRNCPDLNLIADNEGKNKNGGKYFSVYSNKFLMVIITYSQSVYLLSRFNSPWTELKYKWMTFLRAECNFYFY